MTVRSSRSVLRGVGLALVTVVAVIAGLLVAAEPAGAVAAPAVRSVSPTSGKTAGGTRVTLTGTGFTRVRSVRFGSASGTSISVLSSTKLAVTAPAHAAGGVDVRVATAYGTSAIVAADRYTYVAPPTVTGVSPSLGGTGGATRVTLTGTNFIRVTGVTFGGVRGSSVSVSSATKLAVTAPAHAAGLVDIRVTTSYGTSPAVTADRFTYVPALTSRVAVHPVISVAGQQIQYVFAGVLGRHVTFDVSATTWVNSSGGAGSAYLYVYNPSGAQVAYVGMGSEPTFLDFTPTATGTYTVRLKPYSNSTGSATFTYATDVIGGALTSTVPVNPVLAYRGQWANYTFAAVLGHHVTFDVSATTWTRSPGGAGQAYLYVYNPSGAQVAYVGMGSEPTFLDFTPTATGTYTVRLKPYSNSTGSATFTYATDVIGGALTSTVPVNPVVTYRGQWANYTFAAVLGHHVTFDVSATTWVRSPGGAGSAYLYVYNPSGAQVAYVGMGSEPTFLDFTPTATGTYTVRLKPYSNSTGSATITPAF